MEEAQESGGGIRSALPLGSLISPSGNEVELPELEGKTIGLYFAANWYPKCEAFTPALAAAYRQLRGRGAGFEVVFVSCDEDRPSFERFHRAMPWPAVPFGDIPCKKSLSDMFQVEGIPRLVVLAPDGAEVVCSDAVELVHRYGDPAFPFTPARVAELEAAERSKFASQTLDKLFSVSHVKNGGDQQVVSVLPPPSVPIASLVGKTVGLYFSADGCEPCVKFTERLAAIYGNLKRRSAEFEVVYIPMDKEEGGYERSRGDMPWPALPYDGGEGAPSRELARYFDVREIPTLVVIGPDGKTVTREGRNLVNLYFDMAFPFTEEQVRRLQELEDERAKGYSPSLRHAGHRHELSVVSEKSGGGPYVCCECDEQGFGWAYQCIACGYEIHLRCGRDGEDGGAVGAEQ
ncbi:probable nucleoredoxin 2 isoform X1 [Hordeum vulgare subsp. vulgare]|uniref:probable nucleoredoxin 2 isoform X1 n=1 Tax=Hordeum vulgare subsp. vulgare TaxID=112509 RepID=UPI001D1A3930|nr:probable nucleoredoxin 2 isoform X1 [Hordeum vulgare subsp. vulgare]